MTEDQIRVRFSWYNDKWNMSLETSGYDDVGAGDIIHKVETDEGEYRLRKHPFKFFTVYSFGFMYNKASRRPGHGGEWSSREGVINPIFGTNLVGTSINSAVAKLDKNDVEKLLPPGGTITLEKARFSNEEQYWTIHLPLDHTKQKEVTYTLVLEPINK